MVLQKERASLNKFQIANFQPSKHAFKENGQWAYPSLPWYKINVDSAVFENQQASGMGVVIRDHGCLVAATMSKRLNFPLEPLEVEAKAFEEAIDFAWDIGIRNAHFECDS